MSIVQDHGLEVIRKSAEDIGDNSYALRVRLPDATDEATTDSKQLLYELKSEFEKLNRSIGVVIKHLSQITEITFED